MRTEKVHTLILGAGPSGLAAGYTLANDGKEPVIVERAGVAGGLMRSIKRGDFVVDVGRKELYNRLEKVDRFWNELLGADYRTYDHRGGMLYDGTLIDMTPNFQGLRRGMPMGMFIGCAADFFWNRVKPGKPTPNSVAEYFYQKRGKKMTRIFSQGFQEKLTGRDWTKIPLPDEWKNGGGDSSFFTTLGAMVNRAFSKKEVNTFEGVWKHPAKGTGQICERILDGMLKNGGRILYKSGLEGMKANDGRISEVTVKMEEEDVRFEPEHVISSVPLELLISWLSAEESKPGDAPKRPAAPKRTVVLTYLFLDEPPRFPHAWLQVTCPSTRIGRITNYTAFNGDMVPEGKTALCCEFYCFGEDPLLELDDEAIVKQTLDDCARSGLIDANRCIDKLVLRLPGADASQNRDNWMQAHRMRQIETLAQFKNLYCVNRTELDIATLAGIEAAEAITGGDRSEFDRRVNPHELGIRSEAKAFSFDLPPSVARGG